MLGIEVLSIAFSVGRCRGRRVNEVKEMRPINPIPTLALPLKGRE
jgi:hypothetical protein